MFSCSVLQDLRPSSSSNARMFVGPVCLQAVREVQPEEQGLSSFESGAVAAWPSWASTDVLILPQRCHQFSYFSCHSSNPSGGLGRRGQSSPPQAPLSGLHRRWGGASRVGPEGTCKAHRGPGPHRDPGAAPRPLQHSSQAAASPQIRFRI